MIARIPELNAKDLPFEMKRALYPFFVFLLMCFSAFESRAQFSLSGQLLPRPEYRNGYRSLTPADQEPSFFIGQRTRLIFGYDAKKFRIGVTLQDVRNWGGTSQLNTTDPYLSVHEAWAELLFGKYFSLKMGRQELNYDDERIFGPVDWTLQARSHDIAILKYQKGKFTAHAGAAYNQDVPANRTNLYRNFLNYKAMQMLWLNHKTTDKLSWSFLFINNGLQYFDDSTGARDIKFSQTIGGRVVYSGKKFNINGNYYHQMGATRTSKTLDANEFAADIAYKGLKSMVFTLGYEFLSGTSQVSGTETNNSFTPLFGTNHKFNGYMDYFYVANHINNVGLQDLFFKIQYSKNKHAIRLDVHEFFSAADILDINTGGAMSSTLGTELDLTYKYKISDQVKLQAGYSQMFATESMEAIKGGDRNATQSWGYVMLNFTPKFIEKKEAPKTE
jgi:Alginate export